MWPPSSPDINPVDYAIWGALQQRIYHQRQFKTVEELKQAIVTKCQNSHSVSLITVSMNGIDVLKLLSRINVKKTTVYTHVNSDRPSHIENSKK